jgi:AcrR family transcriptional regulator
MVRTGLYHVKGNKEKDMNSGSRTAPADGNPTRNKVLVTARELFYREGIRAVGVDTIVARSGVAKTSLYRLFSSKDELIASFLREENDDFWTQWDGVQAKFEGRPRDALSAHLKWLQSYTSGPRFRGCPFLNTAAEFRDPAHPGHIVCQHNKAELRRRLGQLAADAGIDRNEELADQLLLLIDGAFANSQVLGKDGPAMALQTAGNALIDAAAHVS